MDSTPSKVTVGDREQLAVPPGINERLLELGGKNRYGEPLYRMVWGWNRCDDVEAFWHDWEQAPDKERPKGVLTRAAVETRLVPRYDPPDRFYLERWEPAEFWGNPDDWQRDGAKVLDGALFVRPLGEFPVRGDYDLVWKCEEKKCQCPQNFECDPTKNEKCQRYFSWPTIADVEQIVFRNMKKRQRTRRQAHEMVRTMWEAENKRRHQLFRDMAKNQVRPWAHWDHVSLAGLEVPREETANVDSK